MEPQSVGLSKNLLLFIALPVIDEVRAAKIEVALTSASTRQS
jgi:hypothetical protein